MADPQNANAMRHRMCGGDGRHSTGLLTGISVRDRRRMRRFGAVAVAPSPIGLSAISSITSRSSRLPMVFPSIYGLRGRGLISATTRALQSGERLLPGRSARLDQLFDFAGLQQVVVVLVDLSAARSVVATLD